MSANIVIYNASAGSGKTYQLALNYLWLLNQFYQEKNLNLKNLLAITFTNKASFEMKERIISFLKEIVKQTEKGKVLSKKTGIFSDKAEILLEEIFLKYDDFQIKTIDSFLLTLYRALSYELNMPLNFQIKTYIEEFLIEKALNRLFEEAKKKKELLNFLESFVDHLLIAEEKLKIDMKNKLIRSIEKIFKNIVYKKELITIFKAYKERGIGEVISEEDYFWILYTSLKSKLEEIFNKEKILFMGIWKEILSQFLAPSSDFIPWIYVKLGNLEGIIIDEFQDTDRVQWEAILPIVEDLLSRNKVIICAGDSKQSIFQWRGGDPFILKELTHRFSSFPIKMEVLEKNYRSAEEIVNFNNLFFSELSKNLELKKELLENLIFGKEKDGFENKEEVLNRVLKNFDFCFENVVQSAINDFKGEVKWKFLKIEGNKRVDKKEEIQKLIEKEILNILQELKKQNHLDDVAILVRKNEEITKLSSFLLSEGFKVVGSSFLKIKESPLINTLISLLKFINYSEDEIALVGFLSGGLLEESSSILKGYYENRFKKRDKLNLIEFVKKEYPSIWETYISNFFEASSYLTLYEFCQYVIKKLKIEEKRKEELPYLYKFLSVVLDFTFKGGDLEEFLEYWERYSEDELEMSKDKSAIKILTFHLAKGLEFKHVILPLSWEEKPYTPDLGLIFYEGKIYRKRKKDLSPDEKIAWYLEKAENKLEIFNLLYVGFTRAIKSLYILVPEVEETQGFPRFEVARIFNKIFNRIYPYLKVENEKPSL